MALKKRVVRMRHEYTNTNEGARALGKKIIKKKTKKKIVEHQTGRLEHVLGQPPKWFQRYAGVFNEKEKKTVLRSLFFFHHDSFLS